jgi:hypothetical protein
MSGLPTSDNEETVKSREDNGRNGWLSPHRGQGRRSPWPRRRGPPTPRCRRSAAPGAPHGAGSGLSDGQPRSSNASACPSTPFASVRELPRRLPPVASCERGYRFRCLPPTASPASPKAIKRAVEGSGMMVRERRPKAGLIGTPPAATDRKHRRGFPCQPKVEMSCVPPSRDVRLSLSSSLWSDRGKSPGGRTSVTSRLGSEPVHRRVLAQRGSVPSAAG